MMEEEVAGSVERGGSHSSSWFLVTSQDYDNKLINHWYKMQLCGVRPLVIAIVWSIEDWFVGSRSAFHEC